MLLHALSKLRVRDSFHELRKRLKHLPLGTQQILKLHHQ
jgi:hypothetical protein